MQVSLRGLVEIASHEGIVPMPYLDSVGVLTFGIGHTRNAGPPDPADFAMGVEASMDEVFAVFKQDIQKFSAGVERAVTVPLEQHEFDALTSFHFNTGGIGRARLTRLLNSGQRAAAADAFMGWIKPPEIIARRQKEQTLFRTGSYPSGGQASVYPADHSGKVLWSQGRRVNILAKLEGHNPIAIPTRQPVSDHAEIDSNLLPGSVGEDVRILQQALGILVDGVYGPITKRAVADYQKTNNLVVDGIAGPQTLGHLGLASST